MVGQKTVEPHDLQSATTPRSLNYRQDLLRSSHDVDTVVPLG